MYIKHIYPTIKLLDIYINAFSVFPITYLPLWRSFTLLDSCSPSVIDPVASLSNKRTRAFLIKNTK